MASEPDNSSWHPALMPNHVRDFRAPKEHDTRESPSPKPPSESPFDQKPAHEPVPHESVNAKNEQDTGDTSFSTDGDRDGGTELASEEPGPQPRVAEDDPGVYALAENQNSKTTNDRTAPTSPKHSSSMSFARTVSHEVSFMDDDDSDWALSRTDTDPFRSMLPSDRTNSFPVIPLMGPELDNHDDAPLPSNQALNVLEKTDKDFEKEVKYQAGAHEQLGPGGAFEGPKTSRSQHASSQSIAGEVQWSEAVASESRYEEGVPLIPRPSDSPEFETVAGVSRGFAGSFENGDNDDFFSQTLESGMDATNAEANIHSLQRKSTMQVLASLSSEPLSRQNTLDETSEENDNENDDDKQERQVDGDTPNQGAVGATHESNHKGDLVQADILRSEDIASKWQEAFASDEDDADFLLEDSATENTAIDASVFLGSDDEGFLDDTEDSPPTSYFALGNSQPGNGMPNAPYESTSYMPAQQQTSAYTSATSQTTPSSLYGPSKLAAPFNQALQYGQLPQPRPEPSKAQSFADKSKGGYASPFDLPTDLVTNTVKPRKRASMQQLPRNASSSLQPPASSRSVSMTAGPPPAFQYGSQKPPVSVLRNKGSFFEDLPITSKPRPSSRQSNRAASPSPYAPLGQAPHGPSPLDPPMAKQAALGPGLAPTPGTSAPSGMNLVTPERVDPYASLQSHPPVPPPSGKVFRYSSAPAQTAVSHSAPPPALTSRYSPAPQPARPAPVPAAVSQPILSHLPRTSSPLAHFEISSEKSRSANGDVTHLERRASSSYEPRVNRVSSLPPTREVEEEEEQSPATHTPSAPVATGVYTPAPVPTVAPRTSPPVLSSQSVLSPPKRPGSSYAPQAPHAAQPGFVPPPRAQTQSPGATRGDRHVSRSSESGQRPVYAHLPTSPVLTKSTYATHPHPRAQSTTMNMVAPTDGRENDLLQRWQGVPIISWGVGGIIVTSFPKSIPRYVKNQTRPSMLRTCGEVKVRNIKDIEPLQDCLAKFPGPLKGKTKKKEVLAWLAAGIESLEKELPDVLFHPQLSHEAKRTIERLLLWKLLRVFVEFDGALEGTPTVVKAVRDILSPGAMTPTSDNDALFSSDPSISTHGNTISSMQSDSADPAAMEQFRRDLLRGDRETAVWLAVDKRLWGHAMLIAQSVSPDLYKRVAQEFVRKEINHPGHSNESLAALYKILSGNSDDCVDELVPVHARAGFQLVSTESTLGPATDAMDGLDKWRETLTLVLSNRSVDDIRGLNALGKLLSSYGRAEAAHICFMFSRSLAVFGGSDDPNVDYVLLGSDHRQQAHQFARDTEALQLSEVYEYGLSLSGAPAVAAGAPHLTSYKLQHAITLAEYGYRDKALQYCDAIASAISSQTRRSPYHHALLEAAVDDCMRRLKQAPKEDSTSWMSKPSMNKVSDSMWNRFNKFVAGDERDNSSGAPGEADNGPFARIGTPTMSRSPSAANFETTDAGLANYPAASAPIAVSALSSRNAFDTVPHTGIPSSYDSVSPYLPSPLSQAGRTSNAYPYKPYEPSQPGVGSATPQYSGYIPLGFGLDSGVGHEAQSVDAGQQPSGFQDSKSSFSQHGAGPSSHGYQPEPISYGYEPPQSNITTVETENDTNNEGVSSSYEPPSFQPYGYEPPSYKPNAEPSAEDDDALNPKKQSFMNDNENDNPALRSQEKSKPDKDREADELFRKAAEEDAKRASAQGGKKGWGFSSWFGGSKKEAGNISEASPNKPIKAKLGEASSFVYDPNLKRWINKKPGAENTEVKSATPPPPKSMPRSVSGTPPPSSFTPPPASGRFSVPPPSAMGGLAPPPTLHRATSQESLGGAPVMMRSVSSNSANGLPSRPPSRPTTSMSNASSIDDLLSTSAPRKGLKKPRKSGRYVDVMAK